MHACGVGLLLVQTLHPHTTVLMYNVASVLLLPCSHLSHKLDEATAHAIVREAVELEHAFVCEALSCDLIGMNARLMAEYIEFVADRLLVALGYAKLYGSHNPFDWMELISLQGKVGAMGTWCMQVMGLGFRGDAGKECGVGVQVGWCFVWLV